MFNAGRNFLYLSLSQETPLLTLFQREAVHGIFSILLDSLKLGEN